MQIISRKLASLAAAAMVSGLALCLSPVSMATPAWSLPDSGIRLEGRAQQAYVRSQMAPLFQPRLRRSAQKPVPFAAPDGWEYNVFTVGEVKAEHLGNPDLPAGRVLLQLHGGGYIAGQSDRHRELAVKQGVLSEARDIYMINYRLLPDHPYPAALEDAYALWQRLISEGHAASDIVVAGDSAGGNLALELCLRLKAEGLPQPALLLLASPWATLEADIPSRSYNAQDDLILGTINPVMFKAVQQQVYGGSLPAVDPRLSPVWADLSGLPPMLIQAGGNEMFLDENIALAHKAQYNGVDVTLTVYDGMSHDFALMLPELQESVDSFREIRDFVQKHLGPVSRETVKQVQ